MNYILKETVLSLQHVDGITMSLCTGCCSADGCFILAVATSPLLYTCCQQEPKNQQTKLFLLKHFEA